jgi:hypothetical protein
MAFMSDWQSAVKMNLFGTMVDYTGALKDFQLKLKVQSKEEYVLGSQDPIIVTGTRMYDVSADVLRDTSTTSAYYGLEAKALARASVAFEYYEPDTATGSLKKTGSFLVEGLDSIGGGKAGESGYKVSKLTGKVTGAITPSVVTP